MKGICRSGEFQGRTCPGQCKGYVAPTCPWIDRSTKIPNDAGIKGEVEGDLALRHRIKDMNPLPQVQYSTKAQLIQLADLGVKCGLYDAVDVVRSLIELNYATMKGD
jgi:hypothetical protein